MELYEAQKQRKKLEHDLSLIKNRVRLLQIEDQKTWKKINAANERLKQLRIVRMRKKKETEYWENEEKEREIDEIRKKRRVAELKKISERNSIVSTERGKIYLNQKRYRDMIKSNTAKKHKRILTGEIKDKNIGTYIGNISKKLYFKKMHSNL